MQVKDVMTSTADYIRFEAGLDEAARRMAKDDVGFLPVSDEREDRLKGVVTDRDIAIRAVAEGKDPKTTRVGDVITNRVLYCFQNDEVEKAVKSMRDQEVYRLVVLDDENNKKLVGVVSLNDVSRHSREQLAGLAAGEIAAA